MIKDIMDQIPPYAIMYLVNAVAFEGECRTRMKRTGA